MKSVLKQREGSRVTTRSHCEGTRLPQDFAKGKIMRVQKGKSAQERFLGGMNRDSLKRSSCWKATRCWPSDAGGRLARLLLCL